MPSVVNCPSCSRRLRVPDALIGQRVKCPTCATLFTADLNGNGAPSAEEEPGPARRASLDPERQKPVRMRVEDDVEPQSFRREDDADDEDEDRPRRRRRSLRRQSKPGKVQAIGVMMLVGGILAVILALALGLGTMGVCCLWPGSYYSIVMGILAIIKGSQLLGENAREQPLPRGIAIMMVINIVNGDVPNLAMGIICLVFLAEEEVARYFRG